MAAQTLEFRADKLGHLLGHKGHTIQRVKEVSGVERLHIPASEKDRAKTQPYINVEVQGSPEQVDYCRRLLDGIVIEDQSELGHVVKYVPVEPSVIGKLMGQRGKTVREISDATGAYIEIQQDRTKGMHDTPQLFIAGPPDVVENCVSLVHRFINAPGANLSAVLQEGGYGAGQQQQWGSSTPSLSSGAMAVIDPEGPKEEQFVDVPARRKGHLLGLKGQTIELIRQTSGVIKCHIQAEKDRGYTPKQGLITVQIFGSPDRVGYCAQLVEAVVSGDHTGIGHVSDVISVDPVKAERLKGERWQVINALKELTNCYMDILQGPEDGVYNGETQLFMAGPPADLDRAKTIVSALLNLMDQLPAGGEASPEMISSLIGKLLPGGVNAASPPSQVHPPRNAPPAPPQASASHTNSGSYGTHSSSRHSSHGGSYGQASGRAADPNVLSTLHTAIQTLTRLASAQQQAQLWGTSPPNDLCSSLSQVISELQSVVHSVGSGPSPAGTSNFQSGYQGGQQYHSNSLPRLAASGRSGGRSRSPRRASAPAAPLSTYSGTGGSRSSNGGMSGDATTTIQFPSAKLGQLLGYKGLTIQKVKEASGVPRLHIPPNEKEKAKTQSTIPIELQGTHEQVDHARRLLDGVIAGDQSELGHHTQYMSIEPGVIGKLMGHKGKTVKELTDATGAYIEIQQDRSKGMDDTPQLFFAGPRDAVDNAVQLVVRFIAAPGADLQTILADSQGSIGGYADADPSSLAAFDPEGPKEERIVEIPARKKGHLLGLKGQTIELVRQTAGVIKCHIMVERVGQVDKVGSIPVQIFGAPDRVAYCVSLVEAVVAGDHSGIGHSSDWIQIDPNKVERLKGERWQVINALKDLTKCYMDLLQGVESGLSPGETQLFVAGPPECVERARTIVTALISLMDHIPANGEASPELLGGLIGTLLPGMAGGSGTSGLASALSSLAASGRR